MADNQNFPNTSANPNQAPYPQPVPSTPSYTPIGAGSPQPEVVTSNNPFENGNVQQANNTGATFNPNMSGQAYPNNAQSNPQPEPQNINSFAYGQQPSGNVNQPGQEYIDLSPVQGAGIPGNQYFQVEGQATQVQPTKNKDILGKFNKIDLKKLQDWALKKWWLILLVVIALAVLALGIFAILARPVAPTGPFNNVVGVIQAPVTSPGGSPNTWKVKITNNEKVNLEDVEISLKFDKAFRYTKSINPEPSDTLGTKYTYSQIAGSGLGTSEVLIQFEGVLNGQIDEETVMSGTITYTPSPLKGTANNRKSIAISASKTKITAPEIKLLLVPRDQEVQNGSEAQITATFENTSGRELKDLQIRMNYPDRNSFTYSTSQLNLGGGASPKDSPDNGNNIWNVPSLPSQRQATLTIAGILSGAENSKQIFTMEISVKNGDTFQVLANTSRDITVKSQPLIISTLIEGRDSTKMFKSGETLVVTVNYQNKSSQTLQNLEILSFLDDPASLLDYDTVSFVGGSSGNISNKVIQWRSSGNPSFLNVVPQQKGSVSFTIRTKTGAAFIASKLNQNAYTLLPRAQAKSINLSQIETAGEIYKAQGDLEFTQTITQKPNTSGNANLRTYTVTWTLKTRQNKVNEVTIATTTNLPPANAWKQASVSPASLSSQISYDAAIGKIIWKAGDLASYTGLSNPVVSISFDMEYIQGSTASNKLFDIPNITGVDDFTGEKFVLQGQAGTAN
jgi:hypothetical protein